MRHKCVPSSTSPSYSFFAILGELLLARLSVKLFNLWRTFTCESPLFRFLLITYGYFEFLIRIIASLMDSNFVLLALFLYRPWWIILFIQRFTASDAPYLSSPIIYRVIQTILWILVHNVPSVWQTFPLGSHVLHLSRHFNIIKTSRASWEEFQRGEGNLENFSIFKTQKPPTPNLLEIRL